MAQLGFRTVDEMIGRTDKLEVSRAVQHWKAKAASITPTFCTSQQVGPEIGRYCQIEQNHGLDLALDNQVLFDLAKPAPRPSGNRLKRPLPIRNVNRVVGTLLGSELTRRFGPEGLAGRYDSLPVSKGSAGQSFAAFVPPGMTMELEGDANDYFGKGLSGGKLILYPPARVDVYG